MTDLQYPTWDVLDTGVHNRRTAKTLDVMSVPIMDPDTGEERTVLVNRAALSRLLQREEAARRRAKEKRDHFRVFRPVYQTIEFLGILSILSTLVWVMAFAMQLKWL